MTTNDKTRSGIVAVLDRIASDPQHEVFEDDMNQVFALLRIFDRDRYYLMNVKVGNLLKETATSIHFVNASFKDMKSAYMKHLSPTEYPGHKVAASRVNEEKLAIQNNLKYLCGNGTTTFGLRIFGDKQK